MAVVVVILLFVFDVGGIASKIFGSSDIDVTAMSEKCNSVISAASNPATAYCYDRIQINTNKYVNCQYAIENLGAQIDPGLQQGLQPCGDKAYVTICNKLELEGAKDIKKITVNGIQCGTGVGGNGGETKTTCKGLDGEWTNTCIVDDDYEIITDKVTDKSDMPTDKPICCKAL